jgi:hypothetical protein
MPSNATTAKKGVKRVKKNEPECKLEPEPECKLEPESNPEKEVLSQQESIQINIQEPAQAILVPDLEQESISNTDYEAKHEEIQFHSIESAHTLDPITVHSLDPEPLLKKRGRKPKGGKIVQNMVPLTPIQETKPNVILHLKCSLQDLQLVGDYNANLTSSNIYSYQFDTDKTESTYELLDKNIPTDVYDPSSFYLKSQLYSANESTTDILDHDDPVTSSAINSANKNYDAKEIHRKLKVLEQNLHSNNILEKKSACFWCTYDFDNPPIYIPKHFIKNSYHVYGCFCTPECAVAYLMNENIDSSAKFERSQLVNHVYSKIYEYKKNIKPAPNPYYMLDKYYGNLSIQEYRSLLKTERLFLIVDKPLTRILPEFHEDNDDYILNNKIIPTNPYQIKKKGANQSSSSKPAGKNSIFQQ